MTKPTLYPYTSESDWLTLRAPDITSTETAALFGVSPYETKYELYQRKRGAIESSFEENERMFWGKHLEGAIAAGIADKLGLAIQPFKVYARHGDIPRMGSSFDFEILGTEESDPVSKDFTIVTPDPRGPGILEIKNVDSLIARDQWIAGGDEENPEAPIHIELQLQHQLEVTDREWGIIVALVGGNRPIVIWRTRDRMIGAMIREKVSAFIYDLEHGNEPAPDFSRDLDAIARLYNVAEPGKFIDLRDGAAVDEVQRERIAILCETYHELGKAMKSLEEKRDYCKAELLAEVKDAEKVLLPTFTISAGTVGEAEIAYTRKAYRLFKVTPKKLDAKKSGRA